MFFKLNLFSGTQGRLKGLMFFCKEETGNMAGRRCLSPERPSQGPAQSYNWPVWASYQGVCGVIRGDGSPWEDGEQTGESSEKGCLSFYYQHTQLIQQNCPPNVSACPSSFIAGFSALSPIKGMALMAFDPHWIDKSMEKLQKHSSINPFESQKKKKKAFYVNTQASTGLAGFLKNTRKKFCHDLAVRPPHPLYSPTPPPACTCRDRIQVWVVKAVSNNTRGGLMLNLKSLSRETHWGLDIISHLSLFRCWTFVWGLQSSIIHANASSSKQTTFTLCSDAD